MYSSAVVHSIFFTLLKPLMFAGLLLGRRWNARRPSWPAEGPILGQLRLPTAIHCRSLEGAWRNARWLSSGVKVQSLNKNTCMSGVRVIFTFFLSVQLTQCIGFNWWVSISVLRNRVPSFCQCCLQCAKRRSINCREPVKIRARSPWRLSLGKKINHAQFIELNLVEICKYERTLELKESLCCFLGRTPSMDFET